MKTTTAKGQLTKSLNKFEALAKDLAKDDLPTTYKVRMVAFSILSEKKEGIRKAREKWKTSIIEYDEDEFIKVSKKKARRMLRTVKIELTTA